MRTPFELVMGRIPFSTFHVLIYKCHKYININLNIIIILLFKLPWISI